MKTFISILTLIIIAGIGFYLFAGRGGEMTNEVRFSGPISAYDTTCFADGICSVTVDGKVVIIAAGFREPGEVGMLVGVESISDLENKIGSEAEVYAAKATEGGDYTLYGKTAYYVKIQD